MVCDDPRTGETTDDPIADWWRRARRPLAVVVLVIEVIRNFDGLTSGRALPTVAAVSLIAFWTWVLLRLGCTGDLLPLPMLVLTLVMRARADRMAARLAQLG